MIHIRFRVSHTNFSDWREITQHDDSATVVTYRPLLWNTLERLLVVPSPANFSVVDVDCILRAFREQYRRAKYDNANA